MPRGPKGEKRVADANQRAASHAAVRLGGRSGARSVSRLVG